MRLRATLRLRIRDLKETLFRQGALAHTLENDVTVTLDLAEFCTTPGVLAFSDQFSAALEQCLLAPAEGTYLRTDRKIDVVLTGGGATLPFLRQKFSVPLRLEGHGPVGFALHDETPDWLRQYPGIYPLFPQLAVSIGGAQHEIPVQVNAVTDVTYVGGP